MAKTKEELSEEQIQKKIQLKEDYTKVFSTVEGKRVMADLDHQCFIKFSTIPFDGNTTKMAYNEGRRSVRLYMSAIQNLDIKELKKQPEPIIDEVEE